MDVLSYTLSSYTQRREISYHVLEGKNSSKGEKSEKKKVLIVAYFEVEDEKVQSASFK